MEIDAARLVASIPTKLHIGGEWRESSNGATFQVENPATGAVLTSISSATSADAEAALAAASSAQAGWARTAPRERGEILRRAFEITIDRKADFAALITLEMGKPYAQALGEVVYGAEFLRWFSEEAVRTFGRYSTAPDGNSRLLVTKKPVGPCLLITPWNFPLAMATRKIAPAVAAGCTMLFKPAELTPLTSALFTQVMVEAGLPEGVLNFLPTNNPEELTSECIADPRLRKISFTGSTAVGRMLLAKASKTVLRTSMELGGNAPFIVFEDADIDAAVEGAMAAKMRNMGEACTAANRFYVHRDVADSFSNRFATRMREEKVGSGLQDDVTVGPLIDARSRDKIHALVSDAVSQGAKLVAGGSITEGNGYFYPPTVMVDVSPKARMLTEEIFGPVAPISVFETEDEAVAMANNTEYGLAAYVYTKDLNRGLRIGEMLETGMLGLNTGVISNPAAPFGGVKQSGLGREGGLEGIEEYLSTQYIGIADPFRV
jgi:succinate-semialdehyde dehydrogenase/glutarate-semialdehyde dehydrogenase